MRTVAVGAIGMAYREAGAGRPLVCVHGNFASGRWFTELLRAPPPGWRIVAPDLPNFGASSPLPGPISIGAYGGYLAAFVDALDLERPVLLGHSLGGAVVQACAAVASALVLLSSPAPSGLVTPEAHYPLLESLKGNRAGMAQALAPTMPTGRPAYFAELVGDALAMNPTAFSNNARALEQPSCSDSREVTCPVLVVRGEHDYLVSQEMAEETARTYARARLELMDGVGHSPQLEAPARFRALLETFLEGLP